MANFDTGYLYDQNGKKYDISVVLNFPTKADWDATDDILGPNLIDFYFGEPNDRASEYYFDQFVEKQKKIVSLYQKLLELLAANPDDTEIRKHIDFVQSLIVKIY